MNASPMKLPRLYPILDTEALERRGIALEDAAAAFLTGGAGILQIRHKRHWGRDAFERARRVATLCREGGVPLIVDDRADMAMLLEAGLHVGQDDLAPRDARMVMGPCAAIGFSTHNEAQLRAAANEPVDYIALGPIFATGSKANPDAVVGVAELRRLRALTTKPFVAIGGITLENVAEVLRAGADSVAAIGGLLPDAPTAESLRERIEQWQDVVKSA